MGIYQPKLQTTNRGQTSSGPEVLDKPSKTTVDVMIVVFERAQNFVRDDSTFKTTISKIIVLEKPRPSTP